MRKHAGLLAAVLGAAVAVGALVTSSLLFANSQGTEMVARDAAVQLRAEETLSAATVARSLLREAVVLRLAPQESGGNDAALGAVIHQTRPALAETSLRADALTAASGEETIGLEDATAEFVSAAEELIVVLAGTGTVPIIEAHSLAVSESFDELTAVLIRERDQRERHIAAVRAGVGDVAQAARFLVAFLTPAVLIVGVLVLFRRRQRRAFQDEEYRRQLELRRARDEFLTAVAHELRTPLTALMGSAQILRNRAEPLEATTREEMIDILAAQTVELADLVENLLVFARANVGELSLQTQVVDVGAIVGKITGGWSREDQDRLSVRGEGEVLADSLRLKQVLRNLLSNALRHGGDQIEVRIISDDPNVVIQVADTGPGIPDEVRARMFEPYEHGEAPGQPATLGLGLTVARSLTRRMSGELTFQDRPTESLFALTLPTARLPLPQAVGPPPEENPPVGRITPCHVKEVIGAQTVDIVFQPIVELNNTDTDPAHTTVGVEALARFPFGSPEEWFEAARNAGLRQQLELVAIRAAIQAFTTADAHLFVSINLSYETLMSPHLPEALFGLKAGRVVLELTEASIINHYQQAGRRIALLRSRGYRLAVDDMGTAGTDLWHLVRLRPAFVKPDISLIRDADVDVDKRAILTGLHWLSRTLPIKLIVEGVETNEEVESLRRLGIDWAQGYRFARPANLTRFEAPQPSAPVEAPGSPQSVTIPPTKPPNRNRPHSASSGDTEVGRRR